MITFVGRSDVLSQPHMSIPFQISMQNTTQVENRQYMHERMKDMLKQADAMQKSIDTMQRMYNITAQMVRVTDHMGHLTHEMADVTSQLRDQIANFDDFYRPIRSYFYWEKQCFDIPACWALRSIFDAQDGVDQITEKFVALSGDTDQLDRLLPQMLPQMPPMIVTMQTMKMMMLTPHSSMSSLYDQMDVMSHNSTAMGQAFDASGNDDSFHIPPKVFDNPNFKRGRKMFLSPDGHAVRFIVSHEGDPAGPEGISHVEPIRNPAKEAIKGTPLEGAKIYLAGTAAVYKDMSEGSNWDLMIAGIAAASLMLIITRSLVAAVVIGGNGADLPVCPRALDADVAGHHWLQIALGGADDVRHPDVGRRIGLQPAAGVPLQGGNRRRAENRNHPVDAGTGSVLTSAGLLFAATMASFIFSDLTVTWQVGTTIGPGSVVRHPDRASVHDPVHRGIDGTVVLVAATGTDASRESVAPTVRTPPAGSRPAVAPGS